jgi:Transposase DDE domain group 1
VGKTTGYYPRIRVDGAGRGVVSQAGGTLLTATIRASGLDRALPAGLARWRRPMAVHDPAKVLLDLAVALGLGGDCLADIAVLRAEPGVFGLVASDPAVSRTIDALAADAPAALKAICAARAAGRRRPGNWPGSTAPLPGSRPRPRWSSISTRPWSPPIRTRSWPGRRSSADTAIIRSGRSPTTVPQAPASRWR